MLKNPVYKTLADIEKSRDHEAVAGAYVDLRSKTAEDKADLEVLKVTFTLKDMSEIRIHGVSADEWALRTEVSLSFFRESPKK